MLAQCTILYTQYCGHRPEDPDDGEELQDVVLLELRSHVLQRQVQVEAQGGHEVDDVHAGGRRENKVGSIGLN